MSGIVSGLKNAAQVVLRGEHAFLDAQEALLNGRNPLGKQQKVQVSDVSPEPVQSNFKQWNHGLFAAELVNSSIFPRKLPLDGSTPKTPINRPSTLAEGTYHGTRIATTEMFQRIESR